MNSRSEPLLSDIERAITRTLSPLSNLKRRTSRIFRIDNLWWHGPLATTTLARPLINVLKPLYLQHWRELEFAKHRLFYSLLFYQRISRACSDAAPSTAAQTKVDTYQSP